MQKLLKLTGVSVVAIMATANANAAGYTCEELIEYTSCNPGFYLTGGASCPSGYSLVKGAYEYDGMYNESSYRTAAEFDEACRNGELPEGDWNSEDGESGWCSASYVGDICVEGEYTSDDTVSPTVSAVTCAACPDGYACEGGAAQPTLAPCDPGYYHFGACSDGYSLLSVCKIDGGYEVDPDPEMYDCDGKYVDMCVDMDGEYYRYAEPRLSCNKCPAGSICAGGVNVKPVACPAGSYCATAGLSKPSAQCAVGTYSMGGAVSCISCPTTDLIGENGSAVQATTVSTGAKKISECVVPTGVKIKDEKGIYHFKSNCEYKISYDPKGADCAPGYSYNYYSELCIMEPTSSEECVEIGGAWWDDEYNQCVCGEGRLDVYSDGISRYCAEYEESVE